VSQPRRVAAIRLAEWVSSLEVAERGDAGRGAVGYRIMLEIEERSAEIVFSTTGYLVEWLSRSSALSECTHVVLDEAHERSVDMDLLMLMLFRRMKQGFKFRLVIMSATLDVDLFVTYFTSVINEPDLPPTPPNPIIVLGRRFPVNTVFLEDLPTNPLTAALFERPEFASLASEIVTRKKEFDDTRAANKSTRVQGLSPLIKDKTYELAVHLALEVGGIEGIVPRYMQNVAAPKSTPCDTDVKASPPEAPKPLSPTAPDSAPAKSILIFFPGEYEILAFREKLDAILAAQPLPVFAAASDRLVVAVLHSQTPRDEQNAAFIALGPGAVRLILATNIAESSVTISDVTVVIDLGLRKAIEFNTNRGMEQLSVGWISKASHRQRVGRAGRCAPGHAFCLYTRDFLARICHAHEPPEVAQISLAGVVLRVRDLFPREPACSILLELVEPPDIEQLEIAFVHLVDRGALLPPGGDGSGEGSVEEVEGKVTFLGRIAPRMPIDISLVRLLLFGTGSNVPCEATVLAAALMSTDVFSMPVGLFIRDPDELQERLASSYAGRLAADDRAFSDPIAVLNLFKGWAAAGTAHARGEFLGARSVHPGRFRQFRSSVGTLALRLRRALEVEVDARIVRAGGVPGLDTGRAGSAIDSLTRLAALAMTVGDSRAGLRNRQQQNGADSDLGEGLLTADYDTLRALVLVAFAPTIVHGLPAPTPRPFDVAEQTLAMQREKRAAREKALRRSAKREAKREKVARDQALAVELLGDAKAELNGRKGTSVRAKGELEVAAVAGWGGEEQPGSSRYLHLFRNFVRDGPRPNPQADSLAALDSARSVCITFTDTCPANFKSDPETLKAAFAWLGASRVVVGYESAVVEFDSPDKDHDISGAMKSLSLATPRKPPDSPITPLAPAIPFVTYLTCGKPQRLTLPNPAQESGTPVSVDIGAVSAPGALVWRGQVINTLFKGLETTTNKGAKAYPYWRSPLAALADASWEFKGVHAAVHSTMALGVMGTIIALNGMTLIPGGPAWGLRLAVVTRAPENVSLCVAPEQDHEHATHLVHGYSWETERIPFPGPFCSEDLEVVNAARRAIAELFLGGVGLLDARLGELFVEGIDRLVEEVAAREPLVEGWRGWGQCGMGRTPPRMEETPPSVNGGGPTPTPHEPNPVTTPTNPAQPNPAAALPSPTASPPTTPTRSSFRLNAIAAPFIPTPSPTSHNPLDRFVDPHDVDSQLPPLEWPVVVPPPPSDEDDQVSYEDAGWRTDSSEEEW
ncbi:hypothetical protein BDK51DRAFT_28945, partial [Blyttiomyces helicus]